MSSERRAHWDDALIDAVRTAMRPRILTISDSVDTYAVIAAVEDWQSENAIRLISQIQGRLKQREDQIQSVRELHCLTVDVVDGPGGGPEDVEHCQECGYIGVDAEPCPTIRILDGEHDE